MALAMRTSLLALCYSFCMTKQAESQRDRQITRAIHRLFLRATLVDKPGIIMNYVMRMPALVLANVFIPVEIAYGVQAIVTRQFDEVARHAWAILLLSVGYSILWSVGALFISRNGAIGSKYIQRTIFSN